ncbi:MAG: GntR family transcriptional regulator [Bacteroidales bacterium]|nr:GntR family transcriptional regulator [Bacteroidales bacterium]
MIAIGKYNQLTILRDSSVGLFLGDESGEEVLLPAKYCPEAFQVGDAIEVFVYRDHDNRKIATTLKPKIGMHEFALLQVNAIETVGAFLDWGLEKDLLVPFKEQKPRMVAGNKYVVYMDLDKQTDRLYATGRIDKILSNEELTVKAGEEVDLMVYQKTELGYSVMINQKHRGIVFENEVFQPLHIGDRMKGYIKRIREANKMDVSLRPLGYKNYNDPNTETVYQLLKDNGGTLEYGDKSAPEVIYARFGMSKKEFKKAIGTLYKNRKITVEPERIKLI